LQKSFDTILDFTKIKDKCLFCNSPLRACLTHFMSWRKCDLPAIHSVIKNGKFSFPMNITTDSYSIKSDCVVDAATNKLTINIPESLTGAVDQHLVRDNINGLTPYIELYCPYKLCKKQYYLASYKLDIKFYQDEDSWYWNILEPKLFLESFKTNNFLVQNDWIREETNIYSITNEDAEPIKTSLIDFAALGDNLINRIQTIAVFS
jgi:hypothetical protein